MAKDKYLKSNIAPLVWSFPGVNIALLLAIVLSGKADLISLNAMWYRLYKKHSDKLSVNGAHRTYLLTRDLAAVSAIFICLFTVAVGLSDATVRLKTGYTAYLVLQYLVTAAAGRNYGNRFVTNVLVEES